MRDTVDTQSSSRRRTNRRLAPRLYAVAASLLLHVVLFVAFRVAMTPPRVEPHAATAVTDRVMELRFIAVSLDSRAASVVPDAPSLSPARKPRPEQKPGPPVVTHRQPRDPSGADIAEARPAQLPASPSATPAAPEPAEQSGTTSAPAGEAARTETTRAADYTPPGVVGTPGVMDHRSAVTYTSTRFEGAWAPRDETAVASGLRHMQESTTLTKTVDLGHGVRMHCAIGVLGGGCGLGDAPSRAAAKDGDARLSLPPSEPLAKSHEEPAPAPTEADCILAYRKNDRVLPGCATDTPLKAMDQEAAEQQRRTNH